MTTVDFEKEKLKVKDTQFRRLIKIQDKIALSLDKLDQLITYGQNVDHILSGLEITKNYPITNGVSLIEEKILQHVEKAYNKIHTAFQNQINSMEEQLGNLNTFICDEKREEVKVDQKGRRAKKESKKEKRNDKTPSNRSKRLVVGKNNKKRTKKVQSKRSRVPSRRRPIEVVSNKREETTSRSGLHSQESSGGIGDTGDRSSGELEPVCQVSGSNSERSDDSNVQAEQGISIPSES